METVLNYKIFRTFHFDSLHTWKSEFWNEVIETNCCSCLDLMVN